MGFKFKAEMAHGLKWKNCGLSVLFLTAALGLQGCGTGGTTNVITGMSFGNMTNHFSDLLVSHPALLEIAPRRRLIP